MPGPSILDVLLNRKKEQMPAPTNIPMPNGGLSDEEVELGLASGRLDPGPIADVGVNPNNMAPAPIPVPSPIEIAKRIPAEAPKKESPKKSTPKKEEPKQEETSEEAPVAAYDPRLDEESPGTYSNMEDQQALNDALERQKYMAFLAAIGKSTSQIGSGIAGMNAPGAKAADTSSFDELNKLGNLDVEAVKTRRAAKDQETKREGELVDLSNKNALSNPDSAESKLFTNLLKQRYSKAGIQIPEGMSAERLKGLGFKLGDTEMSEYQRLSLELAKQRLEQGEGREKRLEKTFNWKAGEKEEVSDKQAADITNMDKTIADLKALKAAKPAFDTGAIAGRVAKFRQALSNDDEKISAFKADTQRMLQNYVRGISGLTVTDAERKILEDSVPNINMKDETFLEVLNHFKNELERTKGITVEGLLRQGKSGASRFIPENKGIQQSQIKYVNGVKYEKAEGGWKKVQ